MGQKVGNQGPSNSWYGGCQEGEKTNPVLETRVGEWTICLAALPQG